MTNKVKNSLFEVEEFYNENPKILDIKGSMLNS